MGLVFMGHYTSKKRGEIRNVYFALTIIYVSYITPPMPKKTEPSRKRESVPVPLRLTAELADLVTATAVRVKLSKQDTMRLALERGLSVLRQQLAA